MATIKVGLIKVGLIKVGLNDINKINNIRKIPGAHCKMKTIEKASNEGHYDSRWPPSPIKYSYWECKIPKKEWWCSCYDDCISDSFCVRYCAFITTCKVCKICL